MSGEPKSLQELIRSRQQGAFVGREDHIIQYRENLMLPLDDERRRFIFNISGDARGRENLSNQTATTKRGC